MANGVITPTKHLPIYRDLITVTYDNDGRAILDEVYNKYIILSAAVQNGYGVNIGFNGANYAIDNTIYKGRAYLTYIVYIDQPV